MIKEFCGGARAIDGEISTTYFRCVLLRSREEGRRREMVVGTHEAGRGKSPRFDGPRIGALKFMEN